ncbi:MAG: response regulator [Synechococcales cyanobacterium RU_4_20]|nr:response regulator [Synechococcales cyanobacterium RU_4_20]
MPIVAGNYQISSPLAPEQLAQQFQAVMRSPQHGILSLHNLAGECLGSLSFQAGRVLWATGGQHRWRRWQRLTKQFCPNLDTSQQPFTPSRNHNWETEALITAIQEQRLSVEIATRFLEQSVVEALFDMLQSAGAIAKISLSLNETASSPGGDILSLPDPLTRLHLAQQFWEAWSVAGLAPHSPDLAPSVRNAAALQQLSSPQTFQMLTSLLQGQASLRELAVLMQQDLLLLTKTLVAYTQWDLIDLNASADAPPPPPGSTAATPSSSTTPASDDDAPLILCVDDNPKVCEMLGKILASAGYRYVSVQDSLQALPVLLEHKPDLIFLDLVMPVASGYEVCSQIRRISAFQDTPVVILTGNDGIIDRIRAKASGSTDFLSKPLDVQKVLSTIRLYLPDRVPASA